MRRAEIILKQKYTSKNILWLRQNLLFCCNIDVLWCSKLRKGKCNENNPSLAMHKGIIDPVSLWKINLEMFFQGKLKVHV